MFFMTEALCCFEGVIVAKFIQKIIYKFLMRHIYFIVNKTDRRANLSRCCRMWTRCVCVRGAHGTAHHDPC